MANTDFTQTVFMVASSSAGSATIDMSSYIISINGFKVNAMNQDSHTMGDTWTKKAFTGVRSGDPITISGFYNDAASGPHAYFGHTSDVGAERKAFMRFSTNECASFAYLEESYTRKPVRNELTGFEAVLLITGAITTNT